MTELVLGGENALTARQAPSASSRLILLCWLAASTMVATTIASLLLCLSIATMDIFDGVPTTLPSILVGLWGSWLAAAAMVIGLSDQPISRFYQQAVLTRWSTLRWGMLAIFVLTPVLGQVLALSFALHLVSSGSSKQLTSRRPLLICLLLIALGWPAMFLSAAFAVAPLDASFIQGSGGAAYRTELVLRPVDHLEPWSSAISVYGGCVALPLALIATGLFLGGQQLRRARQARLAAADQGVLKEGETVIRGVVEPSAESEVAVRVEVEQEGSEGESSGNWSFVWSEKSRRVRVAPFYLRLAAGDRVRVEPTVEVHLMDDLDGAILVDATHRIRYAELVPGEKVIAVGRLHRGIDPGGAGGGYRTGAQGWVLGPPGQGRMLLSTRPLDRPFHRRALIYHAMAAVVMLAASIGNFFLEDYHLRRLEGREIEAQMGGHRVVTTTDSEGDTHTTLFVSLSASTPNVSLSQAIPESIYQASFGVTQPVPLIYVDDEPEWSQLGRKATAHGYLTVILTLILTIIGLGFMAYGGEGIDWYERKVIDSGSGRLEGSRRKMLEAQEQAERRRMEP